MKVALYDDKHFPLPLNASAFALGTFDMAVTAMFGWLWRREFPDGRGRVSRTVTRLEGNHGKGRKKFTVGKGVRQAAGAAIVSP